MKIVNPVRKPTRTGGLMPRIREKRNDPVASHRTFSNWVKIKEEKCKGCQLCINFCPRGALRMSKKMNKRGFHPVKVVHGEKCTGCGICFLICPEIAIEIYEPY